MTNITRSMGRARGAAALVLALACDRATSVDPPLEPTLDADLRRAIGNWGAMPIAPLPAQDAALVSLGQSLFFDKLLSGNRDVSCATCHQPSRHAADGLTLSIGTGAAGTGAVRTLGAGRQFVPRNAPSLLNQGLGFFYLFWDGRVNEEMGQSRFQTPAGAQLPRGLNNLLAAQAMLPVANREEMRGKAGDVDVFGNTNELASIADDDFVGVWRAAMGRLLGVQEYVAKFAAAYPGTPISALGFQHAANALAAFQMQSLTRANTPFDRYLARDDNALTQEQKRGALLFFGRADCASCHNGALLGGRSFANAGVPQLGPGVGRAAPLDRGRGEQNPTVPFYQFAFRVPPLRNVELTAPYMHNGAYRTLEAVVRHYNHIDSALVSFDVAELDPALRGTLHDDPATVAAIRSSLDFRLRQPMRLTEAEQRQIVAFLKSLTDPAARQLESIVPARVPSGLPVQ